jgi:hypothetical protein
MFLFHLSLLLNIEIVILKHTCYMTISQYLKRNNTLNPLTINNALNI